MNLQAILPYVRFGVITVAFIDTFWMGRLFADRRTSEYQRIFSIIFLAMFIILFGVTLIPEVIV